MDTFNTLLEELNLSHRQYKGKLLKKASECYDSLPQHPMLFIDNLMKDEPPTSCRLDTGILDSAVKNGDFKKLEVYILWAWLKSDNHEGSPYEQYYNIEKDEYDRAVVQNCYDKLIGPMFGKYYPPISKPPSDLQVRIDSKLKEAKFDVVYDSVYGGFSLDHLTNKYKHKNDLKKKFIYGEVQPNGQGKIDY